MNWGHCKKKISHFNYLFILQNELQSREYKKLAQEDFSTYTQCKWLSFEKGLIKSGWMWNLWERNNDIPLWNCSRYVYNRRSLRDVIHTGHWLGNLYGSWIWRAQNGFLRRDVGWHSLITECTVRNMWSHNEEDISWQLWKFIKDWSQHINSKTSISASGYEMHRFILSNYLIKYQYNKPLYIWLLVK